MVVVVVVVDVVVVGGGLQTFHVGSAALVDYPAFSS